jgi:AcrR family transcriptional regulator
VSSPSSSARRDQLLDAADRVVAREGPAASMSAVAAEAGITKPILYRHFGDKGGLAAALAERHTAALGDRLQRALAGGGGTRRERVLVVVDAYLAAIEAAPQTYRFLVHPEGAARQVHTFTRGLAGALAAGVAAELGVPVGVREQAWAHAMVGMVQTAGDWWLDEQPCPRAALAGHLTDLVLGAYAP